MPVLLDHLLFSDWRSSHKEGWWSDVFVLKISALSGLPPAEYALGLHRLAAVLVRKRNTASLWVQLDAPGRWYPQTLRSVLQFKGKLPLALSAPSSLSQPETGAYLVRPVLSRQPPMPPERLPAAGPLAHPALACLRVLGRIEHGTRPEVAALAGLDEAAAQGGLETLAENGWVQPQAAGHTVWHLQRAGLRLALSSWGLPPGISFPRRRELALSDPEGEHRRLSRLWPGWLRTAWPHAQVWAGWSEPRLPGLRESPDALAWGLLGPWETLFWLEVESGHQRRAQICRKIRRRFVAAAEYAREKRVHLVFVLLGREWVCEAARPAFVHVPEDVAVAIGNWREINCLPVTAWGRVEW